MVRRFVNIVHDFFTIPSFHFFRFTILNLMLWLPYSIFQTCVIPTVSNNDDDDGNWNRHNTREEKRKKKKKNENWKIQLCTIEKVALVHFIQMVNGFQCESKKKKTKIACMQNIKLDFHKIPLMIHLNYMLITCVLHLNSHNVKHWNVFWTHKKKCKKKQTVI